MDYSPTYPNQDQQFLESYPHKDLLTAALEVFHIPPKLQPRFERYYLLHWSPDYLYSTCLYGCIFREDIRYILVGIDQHGLCELRDEPQIRLSFRKLPDMPFGFVLVRRLSQ